MTDGRVADTSSVDKMFDSAPHLLLTYGYDTVCFGDLRGRLLTDRHACGHRIKVRGYVFLTGMQETTVTSAGVVNMMCV